MSILYEGTLKQDNLRFYVKMLTTNHLTQILGLQKVVVESLENKEFLSPLNKEEYEYILNGNGLMIGAFVEEKLIAFRALLYPPLDNEHLGLDLNLNEEELPSVVYQEISNVHPKYRGNRLQQTLALLIMEELGKINQQYQYICCTVAPFNIPSLKDKFAQGTEVAALKEKYGGRLRYIFVKNLAENRTKEWGEITSIKMDDIPGQKALLAEGWRGIQMEYRDGTYWVDFGRKGKESE